MENDARRYLRTLSDEEVNRLILKLGNYALNRGKRYRWRSGNQFELPNGETIDSVVSLSIELALDGRRNWNQETHPDFAEFLMDVIDSRLNHLANCSDNKINNRIPADLDLNNIEPSAVTNVTTHRREQGADWLTRRPQTPEEDLLEKEAAHSQTEALRELERAIEGDRELVAIFAAIKDGCSTDKTISQSTGIDIEKVRAAKKRMARRTTSLRNRFNRF